MAYIAPKSLEESGRVDERYSRQDFRPFEAYICEQPFGGLWNIVIRTSVIARWNAHGRLPIRDN